MTSETLMVTSTVGCIVNWFSRPSLRKNRCGSFDSSHCAPVFTPKNNLFIYLVVSIDTWTSAIICNLEMLVHVFIKPKATPLMYPSLPYRLKKHLISYNVLCLNSHEKQIHGETLPADSTLQEEIQEDYKFNYHSAKLTFGLVLLKFKDAVKEGDGGRLFDIVQTSFTTLQDPRSLQVCICCPFIFCQVHYNPSTITGTQVKV